VNNDLQILELYLKNEKVPFWRDLDDYFLKQYRDRPDSKEYQLLLQEKGPEAI